MLLLLLLLLQALMLLWKTPNPTVGPELGPDPG